MGQNRMARLRQLATKRGMARAAAVQARRRGEGRGQADHRYIVGAFFLVDGARVQLAAVKCGPAYDVPRPPQLTFEVDCFNRWRTRQAADQFAKRWRLDCHVLDLHFLDVLAAPRHGFEG